MTIPDFTSCNYYLPPGIHECTISEFKDKFCFKTESRKTAWEDFKRTIKRFNSLDIAPEVVIINGSFVTARKKVGDIDAAGLVKPEKIKNKFNDSSIDKHDKRAIKILANPENEHSDLIRDLFGTHIFIARNMNVLNNWASFFKNIKTDSDRDPENLNPPQEKGLVKIDFRKEGNEIEKL